MTQLSGFQVSGNAPEQYERFNAVLMVPFVEAVIERAQVQPGASVLDLACGTGFVARRLAEVVGPSGRVTGLDLNPGMVAVARRVGGPAGRPRVPRLSGTRAPYSSCRSRTKPLTRSSASRASSSFLTCRSQWTRCIECSVPAAVWR